MARKYLLLGGSSDVCLSFLENNTWDDNDEVLAQYYKNGTSLKKMLEVLPCKLNIVQADFSSSDSIENFSRQIKEMKFVPSHILHAPAIPVENKRFTETDWEDVLMQLNVQCQSAFKIMQNVIKPMTKKKSGKIVFVLTSYTIGVPPKYLSSYIMTKYALMGLGKSLAAEYAEKNIQINMLSPSMMETKFLTKLHSSISEVSASKNPLKRNVFTKEVVSAIKYLFSDENTFITGANIPITGGENF